MQLDILPHRRPALNPAPARAPSREDTQRRDRQLSKVIQTPAGTPAGTTLAGPLLPVLPLRPAPHPASSSSPSRGHPAGCVIRPQLGTGHNAPPRTALPPPTPSSFTT